MKELDDKVFNEIRKLAMSPDYMNELRQEKEKRTVEPNKVDILKKEIEKIEEAAQKRMSSTEDAAAAAAPTATTAPEPAVPAESATQG